MSRRLRLGNKAPGSGVVAAAFALRVATLLNGGVSLGRALSVIAQGSERPDPEEALEPLPLPGLVQVEAEPGSGRRRATGRRGPQHRGLALRSPQRRGQKSTGPDVAVAEHVRLVARRASGRVAGGSSLALAIAGEAEPPWRVLAAAFVIAERSGAPQAAAMERMARSLAEIESAAERRRVLLTGPRATIVLVALLPLLAAAFGALLGFDPFGVLFGAAGVFLVPAGIGLLAAGVAWAAALVRRIERSQRIVGVELELVWISLQGGGPPGPALRLVADSASRVRAEWVGVDALVAGGPTRKALATAAATGVAAGPLLLAEAAGERERSLRALERAAERLGVTILLPIGTCVLPAFVVLGVLPVLIAMLGA